MVNDSAPEFSQTVHHVFVYGTLRRDYVRLPTTKYTALRPPDVLQVHGRYCGRARLSGYRLVDLGSYPGMIEADGERGKEAVVIGDWVYVEEMAEVLPQLDEYEGVGEGSDDDAYRREVCWVAGTPGYVYVYRGHVDGLPVIASGDYVAYLCEKAGTDFRYDSVE